MAEDRMLSDEILLALIKKNSGGGGGGGTDDYNDLKNQPQIGGVTLQGNKSLEDLGIKNEFIGTTAEWNALTAEQRKAYDTYQLTDDYTEGSGGLPNYSTTEQKTGRKWIDGKDIYVKTFQIETTPNQDNYIDLTSANIDKVLSNDGTFFVDSSGNQAVAQYYNIISDRLQMYYDAVNKRLVIRSVSSVLIVYVTIYYTKKT